MVDNTFHLSFISQTKTKIMLYDAYVYNLYK